METYSLVSEDLELRDVREMRLHWTPHLEKGKKIEDPDWLVQRRSQMSAGSEADFEKAKAAWEEDDRRAEEEQARLYEERRERVAAEEAARVAALSTA